jgi:hypothetical protein
MAKEPVLAPKVTTSWGIDHYAALETGYVAPVVEKVVTDIERIEEVLVEEVVKEVLVEEVVEDLE